MILEPEKWTSVEGYEGLYEVSNWGRIKSLEKVVTYSNGKQYKYEEKILKLNNSGGYRTVSLVKNKQKKTYFLHRLVGKYFVPNPDNKPFLNHLDGNRWNSYYKNLAWSTNAENQLHSYKVIGNQAVKGEKNGRSKLNTADIKQIRALDELTEKELANRYGVSKSTIGLIRRRERWAHV